MKPNTLDDFWPRVGRIGEKECWPWLGTIGATGYGEFSIRHRSYLAHRMAYMFMRGAIPDGLHIDHLCRNRKCVNPDHMEPVTMEENTRRGFGMCAKNRRKTHCKWGHEFTSENTYNGLVRNRPTRICITCRRRNGRETLQRNGRLDRYKTRRISTRLGGAFQD